MSNATKATDIPAPSSFRRFGWLVGLALILLAGGYLRASGLFRGLDQDLIYHPDSPKQVTMLGNFLNGNHVQYYETRFYDGYPFGLNRLDEWIIRSGQLFVRPVKEWLNPGSISAWAPERLDLFRMGRLLRVFYGLITVVLIVAIMRRLGASRGISLAAGSLYAFAPLASTVTHSVTGDIGVDLFMALTVLGLAGYADQGRYRWLLLSGFACGMSFACKYQGGVGLWMVVLSVLLVSRLSWPSINGALARLLMAIAGFVAGVLMGAPGFLIDPIRTWRNMLINFDFIRDYGVPREFLDQPLHDRIVIALGNNLPVVAQSLGWLLTLLSLLTLGHFLYRFIKAGHDDERGKRFRALRLAVTSFPLIALLAATAFKPAIQPYHFSFLLPVMAVSIGLLLHDLKNDPSRKWVSLLMPVAIGGVLIEFACVNMREDFFWRRGEAAFQSFRFSQKTFDEDRYAHKVFSGPNTIKQFYIEPAMLPVFRNRPSSIRHPDADWWLAVHQLPVPSVPLPGASDWIFMNGPVFPRSDRMFTVSASGPGFIKPEQVESTERAYPRVITMDRSTGTWLKRTLVFHDNLPGQFSVGLRSGHWPARYELNIGGQIRSGIIYPHNQVMLTFEDVKPAYQFPRREDVPASFIVPLRVKSQWGPVWLTLIADPRERKVYERFGPVKTNEIPSLSSFVITPDQLAARLENFRYLEGTNAFSVTRDRQKLAGDSSPLAAGTYTLTADVINDGPIQLLRFEMIDPSGHHHNVSPFETMVEPGQHSKVWKFSKEFLPYDGRIHVSSGGKGLTIRKWNLKPDPEGMFNRNEYLAPEVDDAIVLPTVRPLDIQFPGIGKIKGIAFPERVQRGAAFSYLVHLEPDPALAHRVFHEAYLFLHLKDEKGKIVKVFDYPLNCATFTLDRFIVREGVLANEDIGPGTYYLDAGVFNARTRLRYRFTRQKDLTGDWIRRYCRIATITVE